MTAPRPAYARLAALANALVLALLLVGQAPAQSTPTTGPQVALQGPDRVVAGDEVRLIAAGLPVGAYELRVVAPDGGTTMTPVPAAGGRVDLGILLEQAGRYELRLVGAALEARFTVVVGGVDGRADAPAPPSDAGAGRAPGDGPRGEPAPTAPEPRDEPGREPAAATTDPATDTPIDEAPDGWTFAVAGNAVSATDAAGEERWRLPFPPASGLTRLVQPHLGDVWVAHGHQVLALDPRDGRVRARVPTSGTVVELRPVGTGLFVVSEVGDRGAPLRVEARLEDGILTPPARFDPSSELFDALQREADVGDPAARLALDPTNPFLHLQAAAVAPTEDERAAETAAAIATATTFYDLARLARAFAERGWWDAADAAMAAAAADFAERGYDPALLTSPAVHERYGFPLRPLQRSVMRGDLQAAALWATWLHALSGPDLPRAGRELRAYATALAAAGETDAADVARSWAAERSNPSVREVVATNALLLGRGGQLAGAALLLAFLALHLTLIVKYRRAQALALRQAREAGRRTAPWPALSAIRFYGLTEKSVLLLVLAASYTVVALHGWALRGDPAAGAAAAGHLDAPVAAALWADARGDAASAAWVDAYRADRAGQREAARALLAAVDAPLLEPARAALARGDGVPTPSPATLRAAAAGNWTTAVANAFARPQALLDDHLVLLGLPDWSWPAQLLLFWLVTAWHVVWLFVPRPRYAAHAPRPWGYQLLALLIPGSGQADELYGALLLLPWAIFGIDALTQLLGAASPLGIPFGAGVVVLAVLYAVNALGWAVELASVRRRMALLRVRQPDLARAFGLAPATPREERVVAQEADRA